MAVFNRLPGESILDYLWRNFGGKAVHGDSNIILAKDKVEELIDEKQAEALEGIEDKVTKLIQEKIVGAETNSITVKTEDGVISADLAIDESESPVSLSVSENGLKASLEIDTDSSVELSTNSGKLKADIPLKGSQKPLTFEKISSENYKNLDEVELGKIYLISDAPIFYLDGSVYGATDALISGLVTSIRYNNGNIYYTVAGSTEEKSVKIEEVSEENPGLMTSEELKQLNAIVKTLSGVDDLASYVQTKIQDLEVDYTDNKIVLKYNNETFSEVNLPKDKYLYNVEKRNATSEDVTLAKDVGVTIKLGDAVIVFDVENGKTFYIKIEDLIISQFFGTFSDSNTIYFGEDNGKTTINVKLDESDKNLLKSSDKGLLVDLSFVTDYNQLKIFSVDKENPLTTLDVLTTDGISSDSNNLLKIKEDGSITASLDWGDTKDSVRFDYGNKNDYNAKESGLIYFALDSNELLFKGQCYSITEEQVGLLEDLKDSITKIEFKDDSCEITKASGESEIVQIPIAKEESATNEEDKGNAGLMSALQATKLSKLKEINTGLGLSLEESKNTLNLNLADEEKVLSISDKNNNLTVLLGLKYEDNKLKLTGKDDLVVSEIPLLSLKDGLITDVSLEYTDENNVAGLYLVFTWSADSFDTETPVKKYINLLELINSQVDEVDASKVIYSNEGGVTISIKDKIDLIDGDIDTEGSIRHDSAQYSESLLNWEYINNN